VLSLESEILDILNPYLYRFLRRKFPGQSSDNYVEMHADAMYRSVQGLREFDASRACTVKTWLSWKSLHSRRRVIPNGPKAVSSLYEADLVEDHKSHELGSIRISVEKAIETLETPRKEIAILCLIEEWQILEAAIAMDMTATQIKNHLRQAIQEIKAFLKEIS
jgi:DNA-directed RNA polymerase specialized sigma24 family protein